MSSDRFAAELVPDDRIRRVLVSSGCIATLAGSLLVLDMPLVPLVKAVFAILWVLCGGLEVRAMVRGRSRIRRIRIRPDGHVQCVSAVGGVEPVRLLSGSFVLARVAWLRIAFADGSRYGELLTGDPRRSGDWRHLQIIWRQRSSIFGRPERS